jgi:hypothetical protein
LSSLSFPCLSLLFPQLLALTYPPCLSLSSFLSASYLASLSFLSLFFSPTLPFASISDLSLPFRSLPFSPIPCLLSVSDLSLPCPFPPLPFLSVP